MEGNHQKGIENGISLDFNLNYIEGEIQEKQIQQFSELFYDELFINSKVPIQYICFAFHKMGYLNRDYIFQYFFGDYFKYIQQSQIQQISLYHGQCSTGKDQEGEQPNIEYYEKLGKCLGNLKDSKVKSLDLLYKDVWCESLDYYNEYVIKNLNHEQFNQISIDGDFKGIFIKSKSTYFSELANIPNIKNFTLDYDPLAVDQEDLIKILIGFEQYSHLEKVNIKYQDQYENCVDDKVVKCIGELNQKGKVKYQLYSYY